MSKMTQGCLMQTEGERAGKEWMKEGRKITFSASKWYEIEDG